MSSKAIDNAAKQLASKYARSKCDVLLSNIREGEGSGSQESNLLSVNLKDEDSYSPNSQNSFDELEMLKNEDELLLKSEDGKKLTSKERRQLRNRISARHFRLRRKEYISQLEGLVKEMQGEITSLKKNVIELESANDRLKDEVVHLGGTPFSCDYPEEARSNSQASSNRLSPNPKSIAYGLPYLAMSASSSDDREILSPTMATNAPVNAMGNTEHSAHDSDIGSLDGQNGINFFNDAPIVTLQAALIDNDQQSNNTKLQMSHENFWSGADKITSNIEAGMSSGGNSGVNPRQHNQRFSGYNGTNISVNGVSSNGVNISDLNPSVATLLPVYNRMGADVTSQVIPDDQPFYTAEWPLDYGVNQVQSQQQQQNLNQNQNGLIRMPNAQIFQGFLPDLEKQLDILHHTEHASTESKNGKERATDEEIDEGRLKLSLAAAEDVFKKLDAQLASMKLS